MIGEAAPSRKQTNIVQCLLPHTSQHPRSRGLVKPSSLGRRALLESWPHNNLYSQEDLGRESRLSHLLASWLLAQVLSWPRPLTPPLWGSRGHSQLLVTLWWTHFPFGNFQRKSGPSPKEKDTRPNCHVLGRWGRGHFPFF